MSTGARERIYWTTAEAAAYIGFYSDTVYKWIRRAESKKRIKSKFQTPTPPYKRFGKYIRIPIAEFKAWAATPTNFTQTKAPN